MARVTVCMAAHNAAKTISAACQSIISQTEQDWQLIVIDDGSDDETAGLVEGLVDPRVKLITNPTNVGLAESLNRAVDCARGPYIARMDADDVAFPERFARQLQFIMANPDVDVVGSNAIVFDDERGAMGATSVPLAHAAIVKSPARGIPLLHPLWFGKTAWFHKNRYDPAFRKAQDYELLLRSAKGSRFANQPDILLAYRYPKMSAAKRRVTRDFMANALLKNATEEKTLSRDVTILKLKSLADDILEALTLSDWLLKRRMAHLEEAELRRWDELMTTVAK